MSGWTTNIFPIEVGCQVFANSTIVCLQKLSMSLTEKKKYNKSNRI